MGTCTRSGALHAAGTKTTCHHNAKAADTIALAKMSQLATEIVSTLQGDRTLLQLSRSPRGITAGASYRQGLPDNKDSRTKHSDIKLLCEQAPKQDRTEDEKASSQLFGFLFPLPQYETSCHLLAIEVGAFSIKS